MTRHAPAVAAALLAAALAGCPKEEPLPEDAGVDAGVTLAPVELCDRLAAARCDLLARCHPAFAREIAPTCQQQERARCFSQYEALRPSFDQGAVEIDALKFLQCEERLRTSTCAASFPPGYFSFAAAPYSDCTLHSGLLRGKLPADAICTEAVECASGTVCVKPGGVCNGTCSSLAADGEPCGLGCAPGLYCDQKGTTATVDDRCGPLKGLTSPCKASDECEPDLWCDVTCKQRGSLGDLCRWDPLRISTCAPGLACDVVPFVKGEAGACVVPLPQGSPCRFHWSCAPGLVCYDLDFADFPSTAPAQPGSCQPPAPAGENCPYTPYAAYVGDQCAAGSGCDAANRCASRPVRGEACNPFTQSCSGLEVYCKPSQTVPDRGTCTGPAPLNDRCATRLASGEVVQIPCESGFCDTESTLNCQPASKDDGELCQADGECLSGRCAVQEDRSLRCAQACL